jgi:F0F1-type ATP synthase assembly protein I
MPASAVRTTQTTNPSLDRAADRPAISSDIPARLDHLPRSRFHILILIGLGITWILDGIEVTIVGAIAPVLRDRETLGLSTAQIGNAASAYVAGAVIGALVFGWLTDRFGRRTVFYATLIVYLIGVLLTATSWNFLSAANLLGLGSPGAIALIVTSTRPNWPTQTSQNNPNLLRTPVEGIPPRFYPRRVVSQTSLRHATRTPLSPCAIQSSFDGAKKRGPHPN